MNAQKILTSLGLAISLVGCTTVSQPDANSSSIGEYCREKPAVCVLIGGLVVGGVIGIASSHHDAAPVSPPVLSDIRLKHDIRPVEKLANGIQLYAFRYNGDDRVFVGVMAQDLLADARYRDAVTLDHMGFYEVDYGKLGLSLVNADVMAEAGAKVIAIS